jgi:hypothetical protein
MYYYPDQGALQIKSIEKDGLKAERNCWRQKMKKYKTSFKFGEGGIDWAGKIFLR